MPNKCALLILDGFAITPEKNGNAILSAKTPNICELFSSYPKTLLKASGQEAGLPFGEVGNSEVGHTNIGLGRIVLQDLPQIDKSFKENKIREKTAIVEALNSIQAHRSNLHIIGLFSDGGVHCHINHILGLVDLFKDTPNLPKIFLHLISDGRDVDEKSIEKFVKNLEKILSDKICVGSLSGRYFAMDRDKNWDRIQKAYLAILGQGELKSVDVNDAIKSAYERSETDEYFSPTAIGEFSVDLKKDVFIFNPATNIFSKLDEKEIEKYKKNKKVRYVKFLHANNIGILVSTKLGQCSYKKAVGIKKNLEGKGKKAFIFAFDTLNSNEMENFPFIDFWVNTACPRIANDEDKKNVIDMNELDLI